ncbi:odorant receptor, family H, subfamily 132, member 5 [Danio rerio]|uniref:Odorant receptor n=1 Tax=Danio rerio TaxID=7955 RepID=Q2PRI7_DANRE|nr:odorant receptor, family H, subfamily 132, member 5 [Danio rerio]ABC43280.1 odorant receptor [Danio rerio]|eukprot:XP_001919585.2 olfactory receptor 2M5 [Danio rerio]
MAGSNGTAEDSSFTYQQIFKLDMDLVTSTKTAVAVLTSLFFFFVNCVMFFALKSKHIFFETPRYILFGHMLMNDSVLLLVTTVMYVVALCFLPIPKSICTLLVFISHCTFRNAPLTLALMSLERYVAVCFPLRHCTIATPKRTGIGIGIIWFLSTINIITDIILALILNPNFADFIFCTLEKLFVFKWQIDKNQWFDVIYFASVALIIIFTYIMIMITARSVSSDKDSAKKALKTVMLHLIQLGLCLTSFLYVTIERTLYMMTGSDSSLFINLRYLNYIIVLILPRCLSPLIYGMRDEAVWPLFKYFFCYRSGKVKPSVNVH